MFSAFRQQHDHRTVHIWCVHFCRTKSLVSGAHWPEEANPHFHWFIRKLAASYWLTFAIHQLTAGEIHTLICFPDLYTTPRTFHLLVGCRLAWLGISWIALYSIIPFLHITLVSLCFQTEVSKTLWFYSHFFHLFSKIQSIKHIMLSGSGRIRIMKVVGCGAVFAAFILLGKLHFYFIISFVLFYRLCFLRSRFVWCYRSYYSLLWI